MTKKKTRLFITMIIILIIILIIFTGCNSNKWKADSDHGITMFVATDLHYLAKDLNDNGEAFQTYLNSGDGKLLHYSDEIVNAFENDINRSKPDVLIISGDLTNNGEKISHFRLAEKFKAIEKSAGTRIYVIPGNHDIQNPWARGFQGTEQYITDTINADDFADIYHNFGYEDAISKDQSSLSYLAELSDNLWLLMLDTSIYDFNDILGMPTTNGELKQETFQWINECGILAREKNVKIVTVMHHNLLDHSKVLNSGFTLDNNEEALKVFQENEFNLVLSGHVHIQNIQSTQDQNPVYDIATSSLSVYPVQYGILNFSETQGFDYQTAQVDVETWAKEVGTEDDNLKNFKDYSKDYFTQISFHKFYEKLSKLGSYTEEEKKQMAEAMSILNSNYFAGTTENVIDEIENTPGYQLWVAADESTFFRDYVLSMISEREIDHNQFNLSPEE